MAARTPKAFVAVFLPLLLGTWAPAAPTAPIIIDGEAQLLAAIANQQDGQTWLVMPGRYGLFSNPQFVAGGQPGWYFPITANNLTIIGQGDVVIYGNDQIPNGAWASQDLIAVFGNNCSISGLTLMPTSAENKTVEVVGAVNFTITRCTFKPSDQAWADPDWGGSLYVNGMGMAAAANKISIHQNTFQKGLVSLDGASAKSLRVQDNTFNGIAAGAYAIGNTYWGDEARLADPYCDVFVSGNTFNAIQPGDCIIKARLTQAFHLTMDFSVNGAKVKQADFLPYITMDLNPRYLSCKPVVVVGGTTYIR